MYKGMVRILLLIALAIVFSPCNWAILQAAQIIHPSLIVSIWFSILGMAFLAVQILGWWVFLSIKFKVWIDS